MITTTMTTIMTMGTTTDPGLRAAIPHVPTWRPRPDVAHGRNVCST